MSNEVLNGLLYEQRENMWKQILGGPRDESCIFVAENEERKVVGFASGGKGRGTYAGFDGELYAIYLLAEVQGKGLGSRLFQRVMNELVEQGYSSMLVWTLADNVQALRFYESFKPEQIGSEPIEIGGKLFEEVAYGWREIKPLARSIPSR